MDAGGVCQAIRCRDSRDPLRKPADCPVLGGPPPHCTSVGGTAGYRTKNNRLTLDETNKSRMIGIDE